MARTGTREGEELWVRCPFCGDSERHPNKAHFSVNLRRGVYHCLRCKASGKLTPKQLLNLGVYDDELYLSVTTADHEEDVEFPVLVPGPASHRITRLARNRLLDSEGDWDAFPMYDPVVLDQIGLHLRRGQRSQTIGDVGYSWPNAPEALVSSAENPLRFVEGIWDVMYDQDIVVFGIIHKKILSDFYGHYVILCPDGDVWEKPDLFKAFHKTLKWGMTNRRSAFITGVEFLPHGKDPDEVPVEDREFIPRNQLIGLIRKSAKAGLI